MNNMKSPTAQERVTLADIAHRCGVSKGTVSKALRGCVEISPDRAEFIRATAQAMGYDPSLSLEGHRLAARRHGRRIINQQLAVFLPAYFYRANYFNMIYSGIMDVVTPENYGLLTIALPDTRVDERTPAFPHSINRGEVDGIIVIGEMAHRQSALEALSSLPIFPSLCIASLINPAYDFPAVLADEVAGGRQAVNHLLDLGHADILLLYDVVNLDVHHRRIQGMKAALTERGVDPEVHLHVLHLPINPALPYHLDALRDCRQHDRRPHEDVIQYLRQHPEITAVITLNDPIARRLWYLFNEVGCRVPEDISLIGNDDSDPFLDSLGQNLLTTIQEPLVEIGQAGARLVIDQVNGLPLPALPLLLPTRLVVRHSTAPPASPARRGALRW